VTGDRFIELRHDVLVNILGATDDGRDHPKINHPGREHVGHRRQSMPQRARKLHLAHRAGMADVLRRRHFRGHRITSIGTPPLTLSQGTGSPDKQLRHCGQPLCDRRRLIPRGLTHHIDEVAVRHVFEHTFDITRIH